MLTCAPLADLVCLCSEVLRVVWTALMKSINMTGKNQQQVSLQGRQVGIEAKWWLVALLEEGTKADEASSKLKGTGAMRNFQQGG